MRPTQANTTLDLTLPWRVVADNDALPVRLAIRELQSHWAKITGQTLTHSSEAEYANTIVLSVDDVGQDGFTWQVRPDQIQIQGQSTRGLLYGVYDFLEALGCRWLAPGTLWTHIPQLSAATLPGISVTAAPSFAGRCLILGHYAFLLDLPDWIEWAARNRYNTIFLHTIPNDIGGGAVPEWAWQRHKTDAMKLMHERAMTIEVGGHGLPALLPRKLFKQMPQAFREEEGKRTKKYNFCPSSAEAQAVVQENARHYFRENPGFNIYHIWADDIPGGGWCSCSACVLLSSSDQLLKATNMVAEVLAEVHPQAELSFIAYLDTETPPTQITPLENVCLLWAPRTRNYGRATHDTQCPVNSPHYPEMLKAQIEGFAGAGTVRVFEYYSDAILFKSVLPILSNVMQQDLRFYRDVGVHTVQTLMTGTRPWMTAQLTNWLFGRLTWQPEADLETLIADFCQAAFGDEGSLMVGYYQALEQAFALILNQTPDQREHFEFPSSPLSFIKNPMADMEDPVHASVETLRRRADEMPTLFDLVAAAEAQLNAARRQVDTPQLQAEATAFDLTRAWLHFCGHRIRLYASLATTPVEPQAKQHWEAATDSYNQLKAWADAHCLPLFRQNIKLIHMAMWEVRLRRIQADHFTPRLLSWWVDLGTVIRLGTGFLRIYRLYKREKRKRSPK